MKGSRCEGRDEQRERGWWGIGGGGVDRQRRQLRY